jgi:hypothetical protein
VRNPEGRTHRHEKIEVNCHSSERKRIIQAGTTNAFGIANEI